VFDDFNTGLSTEVGTETPTVLLRMLRFDVCFLDMSAEPVTLRPVLLLTNFMRVSNLLCKLHFFVQRNSFNYYYYSSESLSELDDDSESLSVSDLGSSAGFSTVFSEAYFKVQFSAFSRKR
jgi:hypothetical protein